MQELFQDVAFPMHPPSILLTGCTTFISNYKQFTITSISDNSRIQKL